MYLTAKVPPKLSFIFDVDLQESMNNSELSIAPSTEGTPNSSQIFAYPDSWEDSLNERSLGNGSFKVGISDHRMHETQCEVATADDEVWDTQTVEVEELRPESERLDRGLWLLHGSATRHHGWEQLHRNLQEDISSPRFMMRDSGRIIKRGCDVIGSLVLLIVLFPLLLLVALVIKLDSPGPVFFRHYRVGKNGKQFILWKFRSMRPDVPTYEASPRSVVDDRLTRIGRLIRRLSLDEMPQLINVLKGEMSLVGPRPEMPFIVAQYGLAECERLEVSPGITGLWQISPARAFPIHENLQYDMHYIRNQNLVLDCAIILHTLAAVIHGVGAV